MRQDVKAIAEALAAERKRCDDIVGNLWVDLANQGLVDERHAKAFDIRRGQIRKTWDEN